MIKVTFKDKGVKQLMDKLVKAGTDLRPALTEIKGVMLDSVEDNFEAEGRPKRWPDLKPNTIKAREKKGKWPGKKLQVTGQLASSASGRVEGTKAIAGVSKVGKGGFNIAAKLNERFPFLVLQKEDIKESEEIVVRHFLR